MQIGSQLKKARDAKKLSQQEVSDILEVSQKTLSNIESDKSLPSIKQLATLGKLYKLDILKLLSWHGIQLGFTEERKLLHIEPNPNQIHNLYQAIIDEKDSRISILEDYIHHLKKSQQ